MKSQGYTIQQALTQEAATIVKQAVILAKRRGHAQVTPLHVASTMLSVQSGLLRAACVQAHSHPLQSRALELCFNVALNRLPTSTPGPIMGPCSARIQQNPTIANALVAAFKRAQAHQRRGSIESQQQPLLAVKVEIEQLIISTLDDPSVSRVMREARISSTLVKEKIEQVINNNNNNNTNNTNTNTNIISNNNNSIDDVLSKRKSRLLRCNYNDDQGIRVRNEDVTRVIESLVSKTRKRNKVIVGECLVTLESIVKEVMNRVEKGDVDDVLKGVKFVQISFSSFGHLCKEQVEQNLEEIKSLVTKCCLIDNKNNNRNSNKGLILYFDDIKCANEIRASNSNSNNIVVDQYQAMMIRRNSYCPIEHMMIEIGKLVMDFVEGGNLWLLGIATFQTYMKCKSGNPSLEALWGLHAITIPLDNLGLSLISPRDVQSPFTNETNEVSKSDWLMLDGGRGGGGRIGDTRSHQSPVFNTETGNTTLPSWLQQYKDENNKNTHKMNNDQDNVAIKDVCKGWSSISTSSPSFERSLSFSPSYSSPTSNMSYDSLRLQSYKPYEPTTFTKFTRDRENNDNPYQIDTNMFISSNPNSTPTSTSSSDLNEPIDQLPNCAKNMFKEYNGDNLRTLCNVLEKKVPRHKDIIFDIASTILNCRCGSSTRKTSNNEKGGVVKEDTWLFFQGFDGDSSKESIAKEIARVIFGSSQDKFVSIGLSNFSSLEDCSSNKRVRDENNCVYIEKFFEAVSKDPHRVFFIEDIDQVDYCSQMRIKKAIERGKITNHISGEEVCFEDAIIIFSCERFSSRSRACSPSTNPKINLLLPHHQEYQMIINKSPTNNLCLDLNISINDEDDDDNVVKCRSIDEIGLVAMVDRSIVFNNHQEL